MQHGLSLISVLLLVSSLDCVGGCDSHSHAEAVHDERHLRKLAAELSEPQCGASSPSDWHRQKLDQAVLEWRNQVQPSSENVSITIPVYFHVLAYNATYGTLEEELISNGFIGNLNKGFRSTPFHFELMDVDVTFNKTYFHCNDADRLRDSLRRGAADALNVYVCNAYGHDASGWANYPPDVMRDLKSDGVFIMNPRVSGNYQANYQSLIHETGHWFGLYHSFENGCSGAVVDDYRGVYGLSGDGVADTPAHAGPTYYLPGVESCWRADPPIDTCNDTIEGIDAGTDPVNNYMDYGSGYCRAMYGAFTPGQVERMVAAYETYRAPARPRTCGCPGACSYAVLEAVPAGQSLSCRGLVARARATGASEFDACRDTATAFDACRPCDPTECAAATAAPATPAPTDRSLLEGLLDAFAANGCGCGDLSRRGEADPCFRRTVRPALELFDTRRERRGFRRRVLAELEVECGL